MNIIVYQCCDLSQRQLGEQPIRLTWSDAPPAVGKAISMGAESDWHIAEFYTYKQQSTGLVDGIYFAYVFRENIPDLERWPYIPYRKSHPHQVLEIQIPEIGGNFIGSKVNVVGRAPTLNQYITSYGVRDGKTVSIIEPWFKVQSDRFEELEQNSPFEFVYLSYHQIRPTDDSDRAKVGLESLTGTPVEA
ncbi:hypothetical protein [cf. Phormidesmis sp. LEGE 11477]|uniref:hypothetical protein n=1 Tax=cf. Phormidesmis sp. LEGE 11477 TaxID=1828680 RepID=UPI0018823695|nr:hypothetical protein [cf. Phormidesmis sp. LEGE 11477]MBE9064996.1 hypothetical protein [cf. Phormidesmis sp. LEGE 11477]